MTHRTIEDASPHNTNEGSVKGSPFKKKKDYVELTKNKKDGLKLSQELTYQFSPRYKSKKNEILKPSPNQPPNVYNEE